MFCRPFTTEVSTIAPAPLALCATTPLTPTAGNLKCVGGPASVQGGSVSNVLLGADRTAVDIFGSIGTSSEAYTFCAKMDNPSVKCWGLNNKGQLGLGDTDNRGDTAESMGDNLAILNLGPYTVLKVVFGDWHACAILASGQVKCWGSNQYGQLGTPVTSNVNFGDQAGEMGTQLPFVYFGPNASEVVDIAAGGYTTCVIFKNNSLACWGFNGQNEGGMLGRGISGDVFSTVPQVVDLGAGHHATQVAVGLAHVCTLLNTSTVKCWGANALDQLGNGNTAVIGDEPNEMGENLSTVPLTNVRNISAGRSHTCSILNNGGVTCWGNNGNDQSLPGTQPGILQRIGDDPNEVSESLLVPLLDGSGQNVNATELACGNAYSCARLRNLSIHCWGAGDVVAQHKTLN